MTNVIQNGGTQKVRNFEEVTNIPLFDCSDGGTIRLVQLKKVATGQVYEPTVEYNRGFTHRGMNRHELTAVVKNWAKVEKLFEKAVPVATGTAAPKAGSEAALGSL